MILYCSDRNNPIPYNPLVSSYQKKRVENICLNISAWARIVCFSCIKCLLEWMWKWLFSTLARAALSTEQTIRFCLICRICVLAPISKCSGLVCGPFRLSKSDERSPMHTCYEVKASSNHFVINLQALATVISPWRFWTRCYTTRSTSRITMFNC